MKQKRITILGGGNTAFSTAAKLTIDGFDITLCELPIFKNQIEIIKDTKEIYLESVTGSGVAKLYNVTTVLYIYNNTWLLFTECFRMHTAIYLLYGCSPTTRPAYSTIESTVPKSASTNER